MMRLNSSLGKVCTNVSHFNIHDKLLFMITPFSQESVDAVHRVIYYGHMDMCTLMRLGLVVHS